MGSDDDDDDDEEWRRRRRGRGEAAQQLLHHRDIDLLFVSRPQYGRRRPASFVQIDRRSVPNQPTDDGCDEEGDEGAGDGPRVDLPTRRSVALRCWRDSAIVRTRSRLRLGGAVGAVAAVGAASAMLPSPLLPLVLLTLTQVTAAGGGAAAAAAAAADTAR